MAESMVRTRARTAIAAREAATIELAVDAGERRIAMPGAMRESRAQLAAFGYREAEPGVWVFAEESDEASGEEAGAYVRIGALTLLVLLVALMVRLA